MGRTIQTDQPLLEEDPFPGKVSLPMIKDPLLPRAPVKDSSLDCRMCPFFIRNPNRIWHLKSWEQCKQETHGGTVSVMITSHKMDPSIMFGRPTSLLGAFGQDCQSISPSLSLSLAEHVFMCLPAWAKRWTEVGHFTICPQPPGRPSHRGQTFLALVGLP